jgi:ABC-type multidrug transport system ATPase subunit
VCGELFKRVLVLIGGDGGKYYLKLLRQDIEGEIESVRDHLSFGERNSFALMLFMFDAIKSGSELIILDDPISSFDKNKKYAIIEMLFRKEWALRNKTVLMLTHDFQPIVDIIFHHSDRFLPASATFLENSKGILIEKEIQKADIQNFFEITKKNITESNNLISKLIYLRRLYEISNNKNLEFNLISSVLHKREKPTVREQQEREMTINEIESGSSKIRENIKDFDYKKVLASILDDEYMKTTYNSVENNYEKLHIFRIICEGKDETPYSDVFRKFINQTFHIENDYIYQLNPCKFQFVPQYIIDECDKQILGL